MVELIYIPTSSVGGFPQKELTFIRTKYQALVLTFQVGFRKLLPEKHTIF